MVEVTIDGNKYKAKDNDTILDVCRANKIHVPTLCEYKDLNCIGACRICMVEVTGYNRLVAACNKKVNKGMNIKTKSDKVREARKTNLQLILSEHNTDCTKCVRNNNCKLQDLSEEFNVLDNPYGESYKNAAWPEYAPLQRDESKCIKCMRCVQVCDSIQGIGVWEVQNHGSRTRIGVKEGLKIDASKCVFCGQCITHCPVGALRERDDIQKIYDAISNPDITTVVHVAPAVRTAWAEEMGLDRKKATPKHLAAALKKLGFDYVFDTDFSADLTIMEEGSELLERIKHADKHNWPMFTSCCPAWVRYMKLNRPDQLDQLSSAKSPQQMFGRSCKDWFKKSKKLKENEIFCVSIMPCLAKKYECAVPEMDGVDASLTVREFQRMMKTAGIKPSDVKPIPFDEPMGEGTGAGHIFGATGGVMEAALRTAYALVVGKNPPADAFKKVRGMDGWKEATFDVKGTPIRVAVAHGLANAEKLLKALDAGEVEYDFVEVMTCPGGCAGGGGQPIKDQCEQAKVRGDILYFLDKNEKSRFSHENKSVQKLYKEVYGKPMSSKAHKALHTDQAKWSL